MTLPRFAVVDIETSGLSTRRHRILQLAVVTTTADGEISDAWSTYAALRWPWQRVGPRRVHGITRRTLRDAPPLDQALEELSRQVGDSLLTAHHAEFDASFLAQAARRLPAEHPIHEAIDRPLCTLTMSRSLDPDRTRSHRLGDLSERYGIDLDRPHDALADALATAALLHHLLGECGIVDAAQLEPFLIGGSSPRAQPA